MVTTLLKLGMLMMSNFGYWEFLRRKSSVNLYFLPVITIAMQFGILLIAGIMHVLTEVTVAVYVIGLLLFAIALAKEKCRLFQPYLNWGYAFLAAAMIAAAIAVRGKMFVHYDNFSHWALVVKSMLNTGRFPDANDTQIMFQSYPLGSSAYIYYFCTMTSPGEDIQMLAQAFMMLCAVLPWFVYVKNNRVISVALIVLMTNFLLCYNIKISELLVDTLLPLAGMAMGLFVYHEIWRKKEENTADRYLYAALLMCWTAQIKNSGLFFSIAAAVMILLSSKKDIRDLAARAGVGVSPLVTYFVWTRHCDYVYKAADVSMHAMTAEHYSAEFSQKGTELIEATLKNVMEYAISRAELCWIVLWLILLGIVTFLCFREDRKNYLKMAACCVGIYVIYTIGTAAMYLFSMDADSAKDLGGIGRYMATVDIAIYYLLVCYAVSLISKIDRQRTRVCVSAALIALMLGTWGSTVGWFVTIFSQNNDPSIRMRFQSLIEEYGVPKEYAYLVCVPEEDGGYYYFLSLYLLDARKCDTMVITEESQLENQHGDYEFMILLDDHNSVIEKWLQENYPEQAAASVINMCG